MAVQFRKQVQLAPLLLVADAPGAIEVIHGRAIRPKQRPLKSAREKACAPVLGTADGLCAVGHNHESRQVLIGGAQPIAGPRPESRPASQDIAGVHLAY